jgi:nitroreductase
MPEAIDLLTSRRSVKPIELNGPGPTADELATLLTVASRVPDHGKLTPWRFIRTPRPIRSSTRDAVSPAPRW